VHSGVDGDTPDIIDEEGMTANVTNGMERAALSVHTVHQWLTFLQIPVVVNAAAQQHKQQITSRLHKVELGIISKFWK
jgi:hypothetical protein